MFSKFFVAALAARLVAAGPISARVVDQLNFEGFEEAQKRDDGAIRAFANSKIMTGDGRCLSVDLLGGDDRANLAPLQVADCGATAGQGWDAIVKGIHNDRAGTTLLVSTLVSLSPLHTRVAHSRGLFWGFETNEYYRLKHASASTPAAPRALKFTSSLVEAAPTAPAR